MTDGTPTKEGARSLDEISRIVPRKRQLIPGMRIDPVTKAVLDAVDGARSIGRIAEILGYELTEVVRRLAALRNARLVDLGDAGRTAARAQSATPAPPAAGPTIVPSAAAASATLPAAANAALQDAARVTLPTLPSIAPLAFPSKAPADSTSGAPWVLTSMPPLSPTSPAQEAPAAPASPAPATLASPAPAAQAVLERGEIGKRTAADVVADAAVKKLSGAVRFEHRGQSIAFYLEQGVPMAVESANPAHDDGEMLGKAGLIDDKMLAAYRAAKASGADAITALRAAGVPDRQTMAKLVMWRGRAIFAEVSKWKEGTFVVHTGVHVPAALARCKLSLGAAVSNAAQAAWRKDKLNQNEESLLQQHRVRYLVPTGKAPSVARSLGLNEEESQYVRNVVEGGPMQVQRALAISTLGRTITRMIIYRLVTGGAFELSDTNPEQETPIPLDELDILLKRLKVETHFTVLNAHAVSIEEEIRECYEKRLRDFEEERYPGATAEHRATLTALRARVEQAFEVLGKEASRREYRNSIYEEFQLDFFYQMQIEKAEAALLMRMDFPAALRLGRSALDLKPGSEKARSLVHAAQKRLVPGKH